MFLSKGIIECLLLMIIFFPLMIQEMMGSINAQCSTTGNYMNLKSAIMKQIKKII